VDGARIYYNYISLLPHSFPSPFSSSVGVCVCLCVCTQQNGIKRKKKRTEQPFLFSRLRTVSTCVCVVVSLGYFRSFCLRCADVADESVFYFFFFLFFCRCCDVVVVTIRGVMAPPRDANDFKSNHRLLLLLLPSRSLSPSSHYFKCHVMLLSL